MLPDAEPQLESSHSGDGGSHEVVNGVEEAVMSVHTEDDKSRGAKVL